MLKPLLVLALFIAGVAPAPTAPMKMGLWESTSTVTMTGIQMPNMPPRTIKMKRCVTQETWASNFQNRADSACQRSNESFTEHHYSADFSCASGNATGHVDMDFPSSESGHGKVHMEITAGEHHIVSDSSIEMHFVGDSCGSVQPGHPVME